MKSKIHGADVSKIGLCLFALLSLPNVVPVAGASENEAPSSIPLPLLSPRPPGHYALDATIPESIESHYTSLVVRLLQNWPPKGLPEIPRDEQFSWIRAIRWAGHPTYVGVERKIFIRARLTDLSLLLDDFNTYKMRSPSLKSAHVLQRDGNRLTVAWEFGSPVFFVPNTRYELIHVSEHSPSCTRYRYQLKQSDQLRFSDGLSVLEPKSGGTLLTSYDFFDAKWGVLTSVAPGKIWKKSLEGYYRGDLALKLQAEHADWDVSTLEKETEAWLEKYPFEPFESVEDLNPS